MTVLILAESVGPRCPDVPRPLLPDWFWARRRARMLERMEAQVRAARERHNAYWDRVEALAGDWMPPEAR